MIVAAMEELVSNRSNVFDTVTHCNATGTAIGVSVAVLIIVILAIAVVTGVFFYYKLR